MRFAIVAIVAAGLLHAAPQNQLAFDVASVKPSALDASKGKFRAEQSIEPEPNALTMRNVSLISCIRWAYDVSDYQVSGPSWMESQRFDIAAKAGAVVPREDLRRMLQALLADRFQLALHREEKALPVYALVLAKGGPKLDASPSAGPPVVKVSGGSLVFQHAPLAELADRMSVGHPFGLDRPVVDRTGISGTYDFNLKLSDSIEDLKRSLKKTREEPDPAVYVNALAPLGLKLEQRKDNVQVLVIDHAEKVPTGN